ncbi:MAG TPA: gephyrin-like molybdotransferase Glp [Gemmata sp.]|nr:gephyrin-like molybdotransferase Glp [Gemmata sp.]
MSTPRQPFFDVRMRGFRDRSEVADVLALLDARAVALPGEDASLAELAGRVLAGPVVSPVDVPGFARAAMDGFAVRGSDTFGAEAYNPLPLALVGEARPATPFAGTVEPGQAVRIMTGAPMPAGADAVLVAEVAEMRPDGRVLAREAVAPGRHVGRVGEDVPRGRAVLPAGRRLRPQDVGLLASIGVSAAKVVRRPRVAVLVTGNELLPPGSVPEGYKIVDSNSPMLAALVARDGGECRAARYLPDDYAAVRDEIRDTDADVVLVSGGSSVGAEDHAPRAVAELGELAVHGVALRPASPTGVGFVSGRVVFLLPGNPVSCLCAYDLFAGRVVRRFGGRSSELPYRTVSLPLASKLVSAVGRVDYARVKVENGLATPVAVSGASILSTTVVADGFVLVDRDREGHAPGEVVEVLMYDV